MNGRGHLSPRSGGSCRLSAERERGWRGVDKGRGVAPAGVRDSSLQTFGNGQLSFRRTERRCSGVQILRIQFSNSARPPLTSSYSVKYDRSRGCKVSIQPISRF